MAEDNNKPTPDKKEKAKETLAKLMKLKVKTELNNAEVLSEIEDIAKEQNGIDEDDDGFDNQVDNDEEIHDSHLAMSDHIKSLSSLVNTIHEELKKVKTVTTTVMRKVDVTNDLLATSANEINQINAVLSAFRADYIALNNGIDLNGEALINKNLLKRNIIKINPDNKILSQIYRDSKKIVDFADLMSNAARPYIGNNKMANESDSEGLVNRFLKKLPPEMQEIGSIFAEFLPMTSMFTGKPFKDTDLKSLMGSFMSENTSRQYLDPLNELIGQWMNSAPNGKVFDIRQLLAGKINEMTGLGNDTKSLQQERNPKKVFSALAPLADDIKDMIEMKYDAIADTPNHIFKNAPYAKPVWVVNSEYQEVGLHNTYLKDTRRDSMTIKRFEEMLLGLTVNKKDKYGRELLNLDNMNLGYMSGEALDKYFKAKGMEDASYNDKYQHIAEMKYNAKQQLNAYRKEGIGDYAEQEIVTDENNEPVINPETGEPYVRLVRKKADTRQIDALNQVNFDRLNDALSFTNPIAGIINAKMSMTQNGESPLDFIKNTLTGSVNEIGDVLNIVYPGFRKYQDNLESIGKNNPPVPPPEPNPQVDDLDSITDGSTPPGHQVGRKPTANNANYDVVTVHKGEKIKSPESRVLEGFEKYNKAVAGVDAKLIHAVVEIAKMNNQAIANRLAHPDKPIDPSKLGKLTKDELSGNIFNSLPTGNGKIESKQASLSVFNSLKDFLEKIKPKAKKQKHLKMKDLLDKEDEKEKEEELPEEEPEEEEEETEEEETDEEEEETEEDEESTAEPSEEESESESTAEPEGDSENAETPSNEKQPTPEEVNSEEVSSEADVNENQSTSEETQIDEENAKAEAHAAAQERVEQAKAEAEANADESIKNAKADAQSKVDETKERIEAEKDKRIQEAQAEDDRVKEIAKEHEEKRERMKDKANKKQIETIKNGGTITSKIRDKVIAIKNKFAGIVAKIKNSGFIKKLALKKANIMKKIGLKTKAFMERLGIQNTALGQKIAIRLGSASTEAAADVATAEAATDLELATETAGSTAEITGAIRGAIAKVTDSIPFPPGVGKIAAAGIVVAGAAALGIAGAKMLKKIKQAKKPEANIEDSVDKKQKEANKEVEKAKDKETKESSAEVSGNENVNSEVSKVKSGSKEKELTTATVNNKISNNPNNIQTEASINDPILSMFDKTERKLMENVMNSPFGKSMLKNPEQSSSFMFNLQAGDKMGLRKASTMTVNKLSLGAAQVGTSFTGGLLGILKKLQLKKNKKSTDLSKKDNNLSENADIAYSQSQILKSGYKFVNSILKNADMDVIEDENGEAITVSKIQSNAITNNMGNKDSSSSSSPSSNLTSSSTGKSADSKETKAKKYMRKYNNFSDIYEQYLSEGNSTKKSFHKWIPGYYKGLLKDYGETKPNSSTRTLTDDFNKDFYKDLNNTVEWTNTSRPDRSVAIKDLEALGLDYQKYVDELSHPNTADDSQPNTASASTATTSGKGKNSIYGGFGRIKDTYLNRKFLDASNYAIKNNYKEKNGGTYPSFFKNYLKGSGINVRENLSDDNIKSNLLQGNPVILMGSDKKNDGSSPFGKDPHYVVATGYDGKNIYVEDSEEKQSSMAYPAGNVLNNSTIKLATDNYAPGTDYNNIITPSKVYKSAANDIKHSSPSSIRKYINLGRGNKNHTKRNNTHIHLSSPKRHYGTGKKIRVVKNIRHGKGKYGRGGWNDRIEKNPELIKAAQEGWEKYGILASVTIGQAIIETGWGTAGHGPKHNNWFGHSADFSSEKYRSGTYTYNAGAGAPSEWAEYKTVKDGFLDHAYVLSGHSGNKRYLDAVGETDPAKAIQAIQDGGYCDGNYASSVMEVIKSNDLTQYDDGSFEGSADLDSDDTESTAISGDLVGSVEMSVRSYVNVDELQKYISYKGAATRAYEEALAEYENQQKEEESKAETEEDESITPDTSDVEPSDTTESISVPEESAETESTPKSSLVPDTTTINNIVNNMSSPVENYLGTTYIENNIRSNIDREEIKEILDFFKELNSIQDTSLEVLEVIYEKIRKRKGKPKKNFNNDMTLVGVHGRRYGI